MKRGVVFTTEAVLAIVVIAIVTSSVTLSYTQKEGNAREFETLKEKAMDSATIASYTNQTANQEIDQGAEQGYCAQYVECDSQSGSISKETFCEDNT
ncbi:MAG: hypothetical protein JW772_03825 [Candidatus Diapherotrites archaeon]|nr:hypothetical protein [Candidatus Diapherotrites archaeon]